MQPKLFSLLISILLLIPDVISQTIETWIEKKRKSTGRKNLPAHRQGILLCRRNHLAESLFNRQPLGQANSWS